MIPFDPVARNTQERPLPDETVMEAGAGLVGSWGRHLRVLVVDDHPLIREGLRLSLQRLDPGVEVLEAESVQGAIEVYADQPDIDLVLLDLSMPGIEPEQTLEVFRSACPVASVVVVSASCDAESVRLMLQRGAAGFIPKATDTRALVNALRLVLEGGVYVPPEALHPAWGLETPAGRSAAVLTRRLDPLQAQPMLTQRQMDVLRELLEGKSNKQICRELNMAMGTVKSHLTGIFTAFHVGSRAEAIAVAERWGWRVRLRRAT